jgi:hypothetical protein
MGRIHERPRVFLAACTPAFLSVYDRYPRKEGKQPAAQAFQEIAEHYHGGEVALANAVLLAFDAGMLRRAPYSGPNKTRPMLDRFLTERRWEDAVSAPDDADFDRPRSQPLPTYVFTPRPKPIPPTEQPPKEKADGAATG